MQKQAKNAYFRRFVKNKVDKHSLETRIRQLFELVYMANDDLIEVEGTVAETYPGSQFLITLTTEGFEGHQVKAKLSGKMRMHYIRIVPGDKVQLKLSPYNLEEGRITFRHR